MSHYHPNWQNNRINFILSKYSSDFFNKKKILELGPHNGYIGNVFKELGAEVHLIEGREENVNHIKSVYPNISIECSDLDISDWKWGKWDIIINFGLFYHLQNNHEKHLVNCLKNCDLMFFETVVYDSNKSEIYFRNENGLDQSLSMIGGTPSTSYVENIFKKEKRNYEIFKTSLLNGDSHTYDWVETNSKTYPDRNRRFWVIN